MTYDSFRGVIVFGPSFENYSYWSFWDWDGVKWNDPAPILETADPVLSVLNGTVLGGFAFDANRRRSVWFGGGFLGTAQDKTVLFDGKTWTPLTSSTTPPPRLETAMAYDSDRRVSVMFGGNVNSGFNGGHTNDTWELTTVDVPVINEQPASQYRPVGDTAVFSVNAVGYGTLGYQWYFGNTPIDGAREEMLTIPNVRHQDAGRYSVLVSNECGATWSRSAMLTLSPNLQIFSEANSTALVWPPEAKVVLEVADSVHGPWSIVPNPPTPFNIETFGPGKFFRLRRAN
jgi:hypothetical protein